MNRSYYQDAEGRYEFWYRITRGGTVDDYGNLISYHPNAWMYSDKAFEADNARRYFFSGKLQGEQK